MDFRSGKVGDIFSVLTEFEGCCVLSFDEGFGGMETVTESGRKRERDRERER
ncbi:hypothetical protein D8674_000036 [Pyrus ussuriensis x Pyrus communis]|uniref:Uncharacterized protein n=1 Tax=Pyrus ussuriensis x Pyrus communis TaxID=2448454 RepID=A0A5N5F274_9ROSA|nr:hypothetical protein D8674_000036 [Pyrus ussuriensis x Pyrus communis]